MTLLSCISLLMFGSLVRVEVCAAPVKAKGKSREIMKAMIFPKVLNEMRPQLEKIKVPQYMLDLFAYMTDNKTGRRRANISLPGNIIRSFYSEGMKTLISVFQCCFHWFQRVKKIIYVSIRKNGV